MTSPRGLRVFVAIAATLACVSSPRPARADIRIIKIDGTCQGHGTFDATTQRCTCEAGYTFDDSTCVGDPAQITSYEKLPNNLLRMHFAGTRGAAYDVQASADLIKWTKVATLIADATGKFDYDELIDTKIPARFFRGRGGVAPSPANSTLDPTVLMLQNEAKAQMDALWEAEFTRLKAADTEEKFLALIPTLKRTPPELIIDPLVRLNATNTNLATALCHLILATNRAELSEGARIHLRTIMTQVSPPAAFDALSHVLSDLGDAYANPPGDLDGVERTFVFNLLMAVPNLSNTLKLNLIQPLLLDNNADPIDEFQNMEESGRSLYRAALYHAFVQTAPAPNELIRRTNGILQRLVLQKDRAGIIKQLVTAHPSLLVQYLNQKPGTALVKLP